jgi:hypothetical protein
MVCQIKGDADAEADILPVAPYWRASILWSISSHSIGPSSSMAQSGYLKIYI